MLYTLDVISILYVLHILDGRNILSVDGNQIELPVFQRLIYSLTHQSETSVLLLVYGFAFFVPVP